MFGEITEFPFFEKINFFIFQSFKNYFFVCFRTPKMFLGSPWLLWTLNLWFLGDILLSFVDLSFGFEYFFRQNWLLKSSEIKKFMKSSLTQTMCLRAKTGLGTPTNFMEALNTQKNEFLRLQKMKK